MANKVKHNKFTTIIYVVIVLLVLVAVAGVIVHFTRNSQTPPAEEGILSVSIDGEKRCKRKFRGNACQRNGYSG